MIPCDSTTFGDRIAVFFDFDKTLIDVESGRLGLEWLYRRGMLSGGFLVKVLSASILYRANIISEERMIRILLTFYKNRSLSEFQEGSEEFYRENLKPRLAPAMLERLKCHAEKEHFLVLISGSIRYLLEPVIKDLGFDVLLCTDLEEGGDGLLTGKEKGLICVEENKRSLALEIANERGINLEKSFAYGNHQADLPLLELVGYPHAVEPTPMLARVARKRNWPVLSFR